LCKQADFAVDEHQALQSTLRRNLAPEHVSQRHGPGGQKLAYIEGWRLIAMANEIFGFNGWSHSVVSQTIGKVKDTLHLLSFLHINFSADFIDQIDDKFFVGVSATVRVELKDGAFHEDIGYGVCEGMKSKALSLEKARKVC
jgi:DNA repair and recombination protein RAD52